MDRLARLRFCQLRCLRVSMGSDAAPIALKRRWDLFDAANRTRLPWHSTVPHGEALAELRMAERRIYGALLRDDGRGA
jgi:hypothetical protein